MMQVFASVVSPDEEVLVLLANAEETDDEVAEAVDLNV